MWTVLALLLLLFGGMLAFSLGQRFYFLKNSKLSLPKLETFSAAFLCLSVVIGGTLIYGYNSDLPIYTWIFILFLLWGLFYFSKANWKKRTKILFQLLLCAVGVFGVLLPLPQMNLAYWLTGTILVLVWFAGWRVFVKFDTYPLTSSLVSTSWALALLMVLFLFRSFPHEIAFLAGILGVSVYVVFRKRLKYGIGNLGIYTSEIAGFIWSGIWTICLLQTNISVLLLVYAYYIMEMIVLLLERLKKKASAPLLEKALSDNDERKKTISFVFSHILVMSFLAAVLIAVDANARLTISTSFILGTIVCWDLYNRLRNLDHSVGGWKDIFSTIKGGVSALPKAAKDLVKEVKTGLKTQTRKRKKTTKKSASKKKGFKKKK